MARFDGRVAVLAFLGGVALACGGIPVADLSASTDAASPDGPATTGGDEAAAGGDEVVAVPVDSGLDAAAAAEPAEEPKPEEAASPEPQKDPADKGGKAKAAQPDPKPADPKPADPKPADPKPAGGDPSPTPIAGPKGAVKVEGPGRVVLFDPEAKLRHPVPGDVPVGTYVIRVKFGEKQVVATGKVKVTEAGVTIKCIEEMGLCRAQ